MPAAPSTTTTVSPPPTPLPDPPKTAPAHPAHQALDTLLETIDQLPPPSLDDLAALALAGLEVTLAADDSPPIHLVAEHSQDRDRLEITFRDALTLRRLTSQLPGLKLIGLRRSPPPPSSSIATSTNTALVDSVIADIASGFDEALAIVLPENRPISLDPSRCATCGQRRGVDCPHTPISPPAPPSTASFFDD